MKLETVKADIDSWIENFLEVKNPDLGNWSPCPYARSARLKQSYDVRLGTHVLDDLVNLAKTGMESWEVIIFAYPKEQYDPEEFYKLLHQANEIILLSRDIIALDDHPLAVEEVNGVSFNQGTYTLALVQSLSDLNQRAKAVAQQGFYKDWPEEYLETLFKHRIDPR